MGVVDNRLPVDTLDPIRAMTDIASDERALPPAGRIAEPEDTLGTVFVQSGQVDAETYQPMPSYRLVTANGPLILPKGLDNYIRGRLDKIDGEEKA